MGKLKFRIQEELVEPASNDDGRRVFGIITMVIILCCCGSCLGCYCCYKKYKNNKKEEAKNKGLVKINKKTANL